MLVLDQVRKSYGSAKSGHGSRQFAVDGVSIEVQEGKLYALLGPSGCGKTTTLRMVAGLERPDGGTITVADRLLYSQEDHVNVPAHRRGLGMVFQSYAIWPHLTVWGNMTFALKGLRGSRRVRRSEMSARVSEALEMVNLRHLADRSATKLSGGQQQRLALARAVAARPPVLLLDEPLSNLDMKIRERLRLELKRLQRDLGITTLYVTHDQTEAMALANVVAVMNAGKIVQAGTPRTVYNLPATKFVAGFVGRMNFIDGTVTGGDGQGYVVESPSGSVLATSVRPRAVGDRVVVGVRPENVTLTARRDEGSGGRWEGSVDRREFLGDTIDFHVRVGDLMVQARSSMALDIREGDAVEVEFSENACVIMDADEA